MKPALCVVYESLTESMGAYKNNEKWIVFNSGHLVLFIWCSRSRRPTTNDEKVIMTDILSRKTWGIFILGTEGEDEHWWLFFLWFLFRPYDLSPLKRIHHREFIAIQSNVISSKEIQIATGATKNRKPSNKNISLVAQRLAIRRYCLVRTIRHNFRHYCPLTIRTKSCTTFVRIHRLLPLLWDGTHDPVSYTPSALPSKYKTKDLI